MRFDEEPEKILGRMLQDPLENLESICLFNDMWERDLEYAQKGRIGRLLSRTKNRLTPKRVLLAQPEKHSTTRIRQEANIFVRYAYLAETLCKNLGWKDAEGAHWYQGKIEPTEQEVEDTPLMMSENMDRVSTDMVVSKEIIPVIKEERILEVFFDGYYREPNIIRPKVRFELKQEVDGEYVTISRAFPVNEFQTALSDQGLAQRRRPPVEEELMESAVINPWFVWQGLEQEMTPSLVYEAFVEHYKKKFFEMMNTPGYFYHNHLLRFRSIASNISGLDPESNGLNIPIEELRNLEEALEEIDHSGELLGIKIHRAERTIEMLTQKYSRLKYSKRGGKEEGEEGEAVYEEPDADIREDVQESPLEAETKKERDSGKRKMGRVQDTEAYSINGFRRDIGISVRSMWEANYARILMYDGVDFEYEPDTFVLDVPESARPLFDGKEQVRYTPDFHITGTHRYVEVKGEWHDAHGQETAHKIMLLKAKHPEITVETVSTDDYRKLDAEYREKINDSEDFVRWEYGGRKRGRNLATHPDEFK
ncbi:MAG: hypothetical protein ABIH72_02890 [archaeon]